MKRETNYKRMEEGKCQPPKINTNRVYPIMTKVTDETYEKLVRVKEKLGYPSMYELLKGMVALGLRFMNDYPLFHDGKESTCIEDLEGMMEQYSGMWISEKEKDNGDSNTWY